jgi:hypothetical protein
MSGGKSKVNGGHAAGAAGALAWAPGSLDTDADGVGASSLAALL